MDVSDHQAHEQRLAAALRDLLQQGDVGDYRDHHGHPAANNVAFLKAQALVDEFGLTHEEICRTLDGCDPEGDLEAAAVKLFAQRGTGVAKPTDMPPEYDTWHTGP